jgi:hypothetical protein
MNNAVDNKKDWQQYRRFWASISTKQRNILLVKILYKQLCQITLDKKARYCWLFLVQNLVKSFNQSSINLNQSVVGFSHYFYKQIRELQTAIKSLRFKIIDMHKFKLLQNVSQDFFIKSWYSITLFDSNEQDSNFYNILELSFSKGDKEYTKLLEIKRDFGININFSTSSDTVFNLYLFQFYLRLHELEESLQWFNWVVFRIDIDKAPYKFYKHPTLSSFIEDVITKGYQYWYKKRFVSTNIIKSNKIKLKKKWRFWRGFKKCLLFDKSHVLIKFKWLFNHKRLLNHQYISTYSISIQTKLKHIYKKKISKARLFDYLYNLEYRIDILSMRIFRIKSLKWVWILLYFGYLTVNLKKKKKNYIVQINDLIFGWFLLKNYLFLRKLRTRFYKPRRLYSFLEYEPSINSYIALSLPIKYLKLSSDKNDRLISKKFIKYTYLKTY